MYSAKAPKFGHPGPPPASWPVSRVLSAATSSGMTIHLGRPLPDASCNQPGRRPGNRPEHRCSRHPYSVLLPVGFAVPPPLPDARCALTAPFHPYLDANVKAVCFLWHFPWGRPRRALPGTVSPWSPDFPPPPPRRSGAAIRPADRPDIEAPCRKVKARDQANGDAGRAATSRWSVVTVEVSAMPSTRAWRK